MIRTRRSTRFRGWLALGACLLAACGDGVGEGEPATAPGATLLATAEERQGRRVFRRERCDRCHTLRDAPPAAGDFALPGGAPPSGWAGRAGPDLGLEGHRRSDDWHLAHLYAPSAVVRGSRMPAYRHLFRSDGGRPAPTDEGRALVAYLQALGRAGRDLWGEWRRLEPEIPAPPPVTTRLREAGEALYRTHCEACHGSGGDGRGEAAALLAVPPRDFTSGRFVHKSTPGADPPRDADLYRTIRIGGGIGSAMPGFHDLPAGDLWALVHRVKEFSAALRATPLGPGREAAPRRTPPEAGLLERGREAWDRLGCAACHGPDAAGTDAAGDLRHACRYRGGASRDAMERAITLGAGLRMPAFGEALPDGETLEALVAFLESLEAARPTSPGTPGRR